MNTSSEATFLMDREFKISIFLLLFLLFISGILLVFSVSPTPSRGSFLKGFLPYSLYLIPYILLSSRNLVCLFSSWVRSYRWTMFLPCLYILTLYTIFGIFWGNFKPQLFLRLLVWLVVPACFIERVPSKPAGWREFLVILLLWIPIEMNAFSGFDIMLRENISIPAMPFVASSFGLYLFTVLRQTPKIGFSFLIKGKEFFISVVALGVLAFFLIPLGAWLGFIRYMPTQISAQEITKLVFGIYFLVALPEEILFRGLIQNLLSQFFEGKRLKMASLFALALGSTIFGLSHLNNFSPPNWNYCLMATVAGFFYGFVYLKTSKVTVSAIVHCGVNLTWAILFGTTSG